MISNERQYKITRSQHKNLQRALSKLDVEEKAKQLGSAILAEMERDALKSEIEVLDNQIKEYEKLRSGTRTLLTAGSLPELPQILVQARIMRGLSQKELANLVGVREQQIQRYESEGYRTASLTRLQTIAEKLDLTFSAIKATVGEGKMIGRVEKTAKLSTDPAHPGTGSRPRVVKVMASAKQEKEQVKTR